VEGVEITMLSWGVGERDTSFVGFVRVSYGEPEPKRQLAITAFAGTLAVSLFSALSFLRRAHSNIHSKIWAVQGFIHGLPILPNDTLMAVSAGWCSPLSAWLVFAGCLLIIAGAWLRGRCA